MAAMDDCLRSIDLPVGPVFRGVGRSAVKSGVFMPLSLMSVGKRPPLASSLYLLPLEMGWLSRFSFFQTAAYEAFFVDRRAGFATKRSSGTVAPPP